MNTHNRTTDEQTVFEMMSENVVHVTTSEVIDHREAINIFYAIVSMRKRYAGHDLYYLADMRKLRKITWAAWWYLFRRFFFRKATYGRTAIFGGEVALGFLAKLAFVSGQGKPGKRRKIKFFTSDQEKEARRWLLNPGL